MANFLAFLSGAHVVQAVIIGATLAFLTAILILNAVIRRMTTTVNGWTTCLSCARPGNGLFLRAASTKFLPLVNVAEEAVYWICTVDADGRKLNGRHAYLIHFPAGELPPNQAFWSLTLTDIVGYMLPNEMHRHSLGELSGLAANPDGSVDIFIQRDAPLGHEPNWLPAPAEAFKLTLRAYLPGETVLSGQYHLPAVTRVS